MEMRTLTHSLRLRPTSLFTPQTLLHQRPLALTLRHASSSSRNTNPKQNRPRSDSAPKPTTTNAAAAQQTPPPTTAPTPGTSDFDQILSKLNINNTSAEETNTPGAPGSRQSVFGDALSLGRAVGASAGTDNYRPAVRRVELKLGPTLGRQVHVEPERGTDLAGALRILQMTCNANKLRGTVFQQRYHVRRGQMKKNLRMQRWRKLFKFSFDKTVSKIQRMRAQGW